MVHQDHLLPADLKEHWQDCVFPWRVIRVIRVHNNRNRTLTIEGESQSLTQHHQDAVRMLSCPTAFNATHSAACMAWFVRALTGVQAFVVLSGDLKYPEQQILAFL